MKVNKSLGGRIAHLEVPSSRKISIPPIWLLGKKWVQWGPDNMNTRLSMQGFYIKLKDVTVIWISYFLLFRFLVRKYKDFEISLKTFLKIWFLKLFHSSNFNLCNLNTLTITIKLKLLCRFISKYEYLNYFTLATILGGWCRIF